MSAFLQIFTVGLPRNSDNSVTTPSIGPCEWETIADLKHLTSGRLARICWNPSDEPKQRAALTRGDNAQSTYFAGKNHHAFGCFDCDASDSEKRTRAHSHYLLMALDGNIDRATMVLSVDRWAIWRSLTSFSRNAAGNFGLRARCSSWISTFHIRITCFFIDVHQRK